MSTGTRKTTKVRAKKSSREKTRVGVRAPVCTREELSQFGEGVISYIRTMSADRARKMFPELTGLPKDGKLFALFGASGTPLALTDSRQAAVGHAMEGELEVHSLH